MSRSRLSFLLERGSPPRLNPIFAELFGILDLRQFDVEVRFPEQEIVRVDTLRVDADLYLLKSDTELALSLSAALERMGARVLNTARAARLAKDKLLAAITLARSGLPSPRALAASRVDQFRDALAVHPLILKPFRGYHGVGIAVASQPGDLPESSFYPEAVFAQQYLSRSRHDLKVYGIGDQVFGVRKTFGSTSFLDTGQPVRLSEEAESLARRCAAAFGLELYGLDLAEDPERGLQIIDVNYFPGYRGVPRAACLLADYISNAVRGD